MDHFIVDFKSRLKTLIDELGYKNKEFAIKCGISSPQIQRYLNGSQEPKLAYFEKLANEFPEINLIWLITGSGVMLKDGSGSPERVITFQPSNENHTESIKNFKDHEKAIAVNADLMYLEENNPEAFEKAVTYVKGLKDGTPITKKSSDRRKKDISYNPDRRKQVG